MNNILCTCHSQLINHKKLQVTQYKNHSQLAILPIVSNSFISGHELFPLLASFSLLGIGGCSKKSSPHHRQLLKVENICVQFLWSLVIYYPEPPSARGLLHLQAEVAEVHRKKIKPCFWDNAVDFCCVHEACVWQGASTKMEVLVNFYNRLHTQGYSAAVDLLDM